MSIDNNLFVYGVMALSKLALTNRNMHTEENPEIRTFLALQPVIMKYIICDYKTSRNASLKKHIKSVHEWIKPFKRNICDYKAA